MPVSISLSMMASVTFIPILPSSYRLVPSCTRIQKYRSRIPPPNLSQPPAPNRLLSDLICRAPLCQGPGLPRASHRVTPVVLCRRTAPSRDSVPPPSATPPSARTLNADGSRRGRGTWASCRGTLRRREVEALGPAVDIVVIPCLFWSIGVTLLLLRRNSGVGVPAGLYRR